MIALLHLVLDMSKKLLFVFQKPPHSTTACKEGLDALLAASAFGQDVSVLFSGDGIYQLLKHQDPAAIGRKHTLPIFDALDLYDIESLFASEEDFNQRSLEPDQLSIPVTLLSTTKVSELINTHDICLSF